VVDPVDGTLTFGNGIRGRMLPVGSHNVVVEAYHQVPGNVGNLGPGEINNCEGYGDRVEVSNVLPAIGGRDAEAISEIIRRAPSLLTTRDRAVTRQDFEVIAAEASSEVARAACVGNMGVDGSVEVVILPHRRVGEVTPDPFMAGGLREHCERHLSARCLINVQPKVRLAEFLPVDVSIDLRLRPNANQIQIREAAQAWVARFLDAYQGGLDRDGWPFGGTLFAQDFSRMVAEIPGVRHVVSVQLFEMDGEDVRRRSPGWEEGAGRSELALRDHDLFALRKVRVRTEEAVD
jgi:predicted phage baseplate assembly protein